MRQSRRQIAHNSLLIVLIGALLFVRLVDLHWHQSLQTAALTGELPVKSAHLADAGTPQSETLVYADISITGDDGFSHQLPALTFLAGALLSALLLLELGDEKPQRRERSARPRSGWSPLPPSCGPPARTL